jgi:ATP-dependent Clp protease adaptor protein ClpS
MAETKGEVLEKQKIKEPSMYKVILLNDDYTTMEFVVMVLMAIFRKSNAEAQKIMMSVHKEGKGLCGIYPHDVAETKVRQVELIAEKHKFPLKCSMEEA